MRLLARARAAWRAYCDRTVRDQDGLSAEDRRLIAWIAALVAAESRSPM